MAQQKDDGTTIKLKLKPTDILELTIKWDTRQTNWDTRQTKRGNQPNQTLNFKLKRTPTKLGTAVETEMGHRSS